jgi:hypothetical protein
VSDTATVPSSVRRGLLVAALALLFAVVVLELAAPAVLRPARGAHHAADVLALPGVSAVVHNAQLDPTEIAQVAARQHRPAPLELPAQALLDGLLLVCGFTVALPRLVRRRDVTRHARLGLFVLSLAILLGGIAVVVAAIARSRYLVGLYVSPPFGTLSYLLLYGPSRRTASLMALAALMALKVVALAAFFRGYPRAVSIRGLAALAVTSTAMTVVATAAYALAPATLVPVTDALAAAVVALVGVLWAGVIVSGSVRRLA